MNVNEIYDAWFGTYAAAAPPYLFEKFFNNEISASHTFNIIHKIANSPRSDLDIDPDEAGSFSQSLSSTLQFVLNDTPTPEQLKQALKNHKAIFLSWSNGSKKHLRKEYFPDLVTKEKRKADTEEFEQYMMQAFMRFYRIVPDCILEPLRLTKTKEEVDIEYAALLANSDVMLLVDNSERLEELCKASKMEWNEYFSWLQNAPNTVFPTAHIKGA